MLERNRWDSCVHTSMAGLHALSILVNLVLVSQAYVVPAQDESPVIRECGKDGDLTELYPIRYNRETLIRSSNFGQGQYETSEKCQVKFWADDKPLLLTVIFNSFDIELESQCRFDYLCVNGVKFCGAWEVNKKYTYLVPASKSFTVVFNSDQSVVANGFEISVTVAISEDQTNHTEVRFGYGSAENLLVTQESNLYEYQDRCQGNNINLPPVPWYNTSPYSYSTPDYQIDNLYTTDNWYNIYTTDNWNRPYSTDDWNRPYTTENWNRPHTTENWNRPYTTDNWNRPYTTDNWNRPYTTDNWNRPYTTDNWKRPYTTDNWNRPYTTDNWNRPYTTDTWNRPYTTDNWNRPYTTDNWNRPYTTDNWNRPYTTDNWNRPNTGDNWNRSYTTDNDQRTTASEISTQAIYCGSYPDVVNLGQGNSSHIVRSPGFGTSDYILSERCSVVFLTSSVPVLLTVTFNSFELPAFRCTSHSLCIKGVKFCGNWETGYSYNYTVPAYETFTMSVSLSYLHNPSGFEIRVDSQEYNHNVWYSEPVDGEGYFPDSFSYQWSYPHRPYSDNCPLYNLFSAFPDYYATKRDYFSTTDSGVGKTRTTEYPNINGSTANSSADATIVQCQDRQNWHQLYPTTNSNSFILRSSNFGQTEYSTTTGNCKIQFITSDTPQVFTLHYNAFDVGSSDKKWLCVKGVRFSGTWLTGRTFSYAVSAHSSFTLAFAYTRFEIAVVARDLQLNEQFAEVSRSAALVARSDEDIRYSLTNIYQYQDKC